MKTTHSKSHPLHELTPKELNARIRNGERFQLIDVRSPGEFDEGHVPGAINIPLEHVESRLQDFHPQDAAVLVCRSDRRARICKELIQTHRDDLIILEGGTKAWQEAGLPVIQTAANRLPLMRQVQLVAGPLILLGALMGRFVNPNWGFLAAFVGAGLTLAGATGFCGMANLLALAPWNKARSTKLSSTNATCTTN